MTSLGGALPILLAGAMAMAQSSISQLRTTPLMHAQGTFDVKMTPIAAAPGDQSGIARMTIDKQFHGDLDAHSVGEMMSTGDPRTSAGYVAMERVTGTLAGKRGSFAMQHSGTMENGAPTLSVTIVPGSGSGDLAGIRGTLHVRIKDSVHSYDLEYTLPGEPPHP